ncbi:hypothetical protein [Deinococcus sp.]|uniref:hypothetical protein n=1 Tax=Deinococcus sp. TaxID=47478 RepID=UPI0025EE0F08|nr:hypothetical protein [Deinococcus sp.]
MTDPTPPTPTRFWLPLLSRQAQYVLSTDHYPWSEICADLEARPLLSAVLEARQQSAGGQGFAGQTRRGRLFWNAGVALGGFDQGRDLNMSEFMRAFPRATLQLQLVDPAVVSLAWQCRGAQPEALSEPWPEVQGALSRSAFAGALMGGVGGASISYWQSGKPVAGTLPTGGLVYTVSAPQQLSAGALAGFWSQIYVLAGAQAAGLAEAWRACAGELADDHPCLDPFAREVWLEGQQVQVAPDIDVTELRGALRAVSDASLRRLKLRIRSLPVTELQNSPLWTISGAGELP